jgi:hypothetical protein
MMPCSPLSCTRRFGRTYRLHLQGRRISSANQRASRRYVPPKRQVQLNGLHGVISQKMILFIREILHAYEMHLLICSKQQVCHLLLLVYFLAYSSIMNIEVVYSSKTSASLRNYTVLQPKISRRAHLQHTCVLLE